MGILLLAQLEIAPPDGGVELGPVGRRRESLEEQGQRLLMAAQAVEGPGHLGPKRRDLSRLGAAHRGQLSEGLLQWRKGGLVLAQVEEGRAHPDPGVQVIRVALERDLERRQRQVGPAETKSTPPEPVVEPLPGWLATERALERDDRPPEIAEQVLGPPEKRAAVVVLRVERQGIAELLAGRRVVPRFEQHLAPREGRPRLRD